MKTTILIVEDHKALRVSVLNWIQELFPNVECFEASSGEEAITISTSLRPALVLIDIGLPGINGIEAMKIIKQTLPDTKFVVLTIFEGEAYKNHALSAGANAFIAKREMMSRLPSVLESILNGELHSGIK